MRSSSRRVDVGILSLAVSLSICVGSSWAAPIQLVPGTLNIFQDTRGLNDVGFAQGSRLQFGADIVGGSAGTSLGASYDPTGFTLSQSLCNPEAVNANFCSRQTGFSSGRLDPWTLHFTRAGETTLNITSPALQLPGQDITVQIPFPVSVTIAGSGTTPTISWQIPGGFVPDGFRVNILDKSRPRLADGSVDIILSKGLAPTATSFTLPDNVLQVGGNYTINFQVIETRGHIPFTNVNAAIFKRASSFFSFTPLSGGGAPSAFLPQVGVDPNPNDNFGAVYRFNITQVGPNSVTFIDPFVAVGYDYETGQGNPNFASVLLPNVGDGHYFLSFLIGNSLFEQDILAGQQFFFPQGGVSKFSIRGIETDARLDPNNVTAFITGLTFVGPGDFTGTMTPVLAFVSDTAISEPPTLSLYGFGLLAVVFAWRCMGRRSATRASPTAPPEGLYLTAVTY